MSDVLDPADSDRLIDYDCGELDVLVNPEVVDLTLEDAPAVFEETVDDDE